MMIKEQTHLRHHAKEKDLDYTAGVKPPIRTTAQVEMMDDSDGVGDASSVDNAALSFQENAWLFSIPDAYNSMKAEIATV